eukprot:Plantae.Rhodophyta-Hildenbrandia_rubra.ctg7416.p1 GENE.Plantae.Rhodophyta-Hildenbrandia_rubra.ctg7416~~Plantae.Rhodophyta-Hildenbrandia_rubra.ctg7416.p1  ORF type:complete len:723 (+),score=113.73 Plantae.Rhodophyta-Hildenbrandia_rubra.ctg7416:1039-3207(+)
MAQRKSQLHSGVGPDGISQEMTLDEEELGAEDMDGTASASHRSVEAHLDLLHHRMAAANFKKLQIDDTTHRRVVISGDDGGLSLEDSETVTLLQRAIELREDWVLRREKEEYELGLKCKRTEYTTFTPPYFDPFVKEVPNGTGEVCFWHDGVVNIFEDASALMRRKPYIKGKKWKKFVKAMQELIGICSNPNARTFSFKRLMLLRQKFNFHLIMNEADERLAQVAVPHRDFYNVRKVDTHVHHSGMMNQKHLLRFIQKKARDNGDELVLENRDDSSGPPLSLTQVFKSLDLAPYDLSVDTLDVHADNSTFHRFDRFNLKYNPCGQSRLREIFLKTDNFTGGRYLADITHEVISDLKEAKYQHAEYRISIYGKSPDEWDKLGHWFERHSIYSDNVRWLIQIPRLYAVYKKRNILSTFQEMLDNIFNPLFEATINPKSHPEVFRLLQQVVGIDSVDDESRPQSRLQLENCGPPEKWDGPDDPPYSYYSFYIYSNLFVLNKLRESKGFNVLKYRPHSGEAGVNDNLAVTYLLADGINHGIMLRKSPVLQYLYYLTQIGIAMSPLSNNHLFVEYPKNPFYNFFKQGLNVSLSTDDPLMFHYVTREPLMEEYSVAAQVWKLSNMDLCELARNSVLQSGFESCVKEHWLGKNYYLPGEHGNSIARTNIPNTRLRYRYETIIEELSLIYGGTPPTNIKILPSYVHRRENGFHDTPRNVSSDESEKASSS